MWQHFPQLRREEHVKYPNALKWYKNITCSTKTKLFCKLRRKQGVLLFLRCKYWGWSTNWARSADLKHNNFVSICYVSHGENALNRGTQDSWPCVSVRPWIPKTVGNLCARLSPNRFTYWHILGAKQLLLNNCGCVIHLLFWPWPLIPGQGHNNS